MVVSKSVPTEGNYEIRFIDVIAGVGGPTVAEWAAGEDLTYYFTPDGWNPGGDQATVVDDRLTNPQSFEQPGKVTDTLDTIYVTNPGSAEDDVAALTLTKDTEGYLAYRKAVPYGTTATTSHKATVIPIKSGVQRDLPPEANGVFKIAQKQFVTGPVRRNVPFASA
jgi:hypothetical protein